MNTKTFITIACIIISNLLLAQSPQKYRLELKMNAQNLTYNIICNNDGKQLHILDTCLIDSVKQTCNFVLDSIKYSKGIYTLVRLNKNNDPKKYFYYNVVLDKDSIIKFNISDSIKVAVIASQENLLFYQFLQHTSAILFKQKQFNESKDLSAKDSLAYYETQLNKIYNNYLVQNPNSMVSLTIKVQEILKTIITPTKYQTSQDSITYQQKMRAYFWKNTPLNDERIISVPNFQDFLDFFIYLRIGLNADSINKNFVDSLLIKTNIKNKTKAFDYILKKSGINAKLPFQRSEEVAIYAYEKQVLPNMLDFRGLNLFITNTLDAFKKIANGKKAPNFEALDTNGKTIILNNIKSKYTILAFWDPGCSHCKITIPELDSFVNNTGLKNKQIKLVGIKTDSEKKEWIDFIKNKKLINWLHVEETSALRNELAKKGQQSCLMNYHINQTPLLFLLDENKKIIAKHFLPKEIAGFVKY